MAGVSTRLDIVGGSELKAVFGQLPRRVVGPPLRKLMGRAATPIVKADRDEAPKRTGTLKRAIGKKIKVYPNGTVVAIVGARKNISSGGVWNAGTGHRNKRNVPFFYIHLVEGGVRAHEQLSERGAKGRFKTAGFAKKLGFGLIGVGAGMNPGFPANPFMDRGFESSRDAAQKIIQDGLAAALSDAAAKVGRK